MCLSKLKPKAEVDALNERGPFIAYKVVSTSLRAPCHGTRFQLNCILQDKKKSIPWANYRAGFHVFATAKGAEAYYPGNGWRILRCIVWNITAIGRYGGARAYAARNMVLLG